MTCGSSSFCCSVSFLCPPAELLDSEALHSLAAWSSAKLDSFWMFFFFLFASQPKSESVCPAVVPLIQRVLGLEVQAGRIPHCSWIPAGTWCLVGRLTYRDQNPQKSEESACDHQVAFKKSWPRIHSEQLWIYLSCRWPHIGCFGRSRCNNTSLLCTFN